MPTQHDSFSLGQISVSSFIFEKNEHFSRGEGKAQISLEQGFGAEYVTNESHVHVFLNAQISATHFEQNLFSASATIDVPVYSESIEHIPLQNIVAIMYSYLRPIIAQMTIFAKLPPLDLPPLNFTDFEVVERSESGEQSTHEDSD